jgi:hypothetical protein
MLFQLLSRHTHNSAKGPVALVQSIDNHPVHIHHAQVYPVHIHPAQVYPAQSKPPTTPIFFMFSSGILLQKKDKYKLWAGMTRNPCLQKSFNLSGYATGHSLLDSETLKQLLFRNSTL